MDEAFELVSGVLPYASAAVTAGFGIHSYRKEGMSRKRKGTPIVTPQKRLRGEMSTGPTHAPIGTMAPTLRVNKTPYRPILGRKPGKYSTRRHTHDGLNSSLLDKQTYFNRLIEVPFNDDDDKINARHGRLCKVHGVKLRIWFQLKEETEASIAYDHPIQVRWAIVNPKENDGSSKTAITAPTDFFIDPNPDEVQTMNFPTTGKSFQYMDRKINREDWGVLKEGKFVLLQNPASVSTRMSLEAHHKLSIYVPVNRQMKFADNIVDRPEQNLYFVYWFCNLGDFNDSQAFTSGPIRANFEYTTYFTNSKMYN